jgi:glutamate/tyrosine decarboxylase-like PLP-dependent enzyme
MNDENYFNESVITELVKSVLQSRQNFVGFSNNTDSVEQLEYISMLKKSKDILEPVLDDYCKNSIPWSDSSRYFGHMNFSVLPISLAAYFAASFYNPNNVTAQSSPISTRHEHENIEDFIQLIGYEQIKAAGLMMSGGTLGNFQSILVAKLLKQVVAAVNDEPKLAHLLPVELLGQVNLSTKAISDLLDALNELGQLDSILYKAKSKFSTFKGKVLIPETSHYSLEDACVKSSISLDDVVMIKVDENFQMDIEDLRAKVEELVLSCTPIIAVVSIMGTTEAGAVDPLHKIVELRGEMEKSYGASFYLHLDAAFGGYLKTVITDTNSEIIPHKTLQSSSEKDSSGMNKSTYDALCAMSEADSVVIDPHKMGYVQYGACVQLFRRKQYLAVLSKQASYVFLHDEGNPSLGVSSIEGSRPGAMATALNVANKLLPLNNSGYGRIISKTMDSAKGLIELMNQDDGFTYLGRQFYIEPITEKVEFNAVLFAVREQGTMLKDFNKLNSELFNRCHYIGVGEKPDLYLASTQLATGSLARAIEPFITHCNFSERELIDVKSLSVLRGIMMDPALADAQLLLAFWSNLKAKISKVIAEMVTEEVNAKAA